MDEQISTIARLEQSEANYISVAKSVDEACSTCRWFDAKTSYCGIVKTYPEEITADGHCDRHENVKGEPIAIEELEADVVWKDVSNDPVFSKIAEEQFAKHPPASERMEALIEKRNDPTRLKELENQAAKYAKAIVDSFASIFSKSDDSAFQVFKGSDGKQYWLARHTNMFEDRDKEILSSKAHEGYISRVDLGFVDPPELWAYHTKGTKHGQADIVWEHSGFVFALGHFDETAEGKHAFNAYQKEKGKIELSHGFTYPKWALKDGVYESYNTFEISTLPVGAASNPFTSFEEIDTMALSAKQAEWIKGKLGEPVLKRVQDAQEAAEKDGKILKAIDERYKDFVETVPTESNEAGSGEVIKTLLADLIAAQAASVEEIDGFKAFVDSVKTERETEKQAVLVATKASDDKVAALETQVKQLVTQLDQRPRAASTASETIVNKENLPEEVTQSMVKRDDFWRVEVKG